MSVQKYMHPRNIYRVRPSFKQLAIEYPEFRKYITQDVSGKIHLNFNDLEALRALTCTLLKKDFDLKLEIPLNKMIPTVPLRLNYILWVEDLLNISDKKNEIRGIDIGTGASCIYCLLGAKSEGWHMIGTDVDEESILYAQNNVNNNSLQHLITIKKVKGNTLLKEALEDQPVDTQFDFCMCNPPFFSHMQELQPNFKARRPDRPRPKNAFCATPTEAVHDGGEIKFVQTIIHESKALQSKIRIYTTMLGHKSSLPRLKNALRNVGVKSFKDTEFCQGNTTRWGLAWTFCDINLRKVPEETVLTSRKLNKPVQFKLKSSEVDYELFWNKVVAIFKELQIRTDDIATGKAKRAFCFDAFINTWSHQRKKRRQQEQLNRLLDQGDTTTTVESISEKKDVVATNGDNNLQNSPVKCSPSISNGSESNINPTDDLYNSLDHYDATMFDKSDSPVNESTEDLFDDNNQCNVHHTTDLISKISVSSPKKRECDDDDDDDLCAYKKTKFDKKDVLVRGIVNVIKEKDDIVLRMNYLCGTAGKEGVNQILQYIKNNWNK